MGAAGADPTKGETTQSKCNLQCNFPSLCPYLGLCFACLALDFTIFLMHQFIYKRLAMALYTN